MFRLPFINVCIIGQQNNEDLKAREDKSELPHHQTPSKIATSTLAPNVPIAEPPKAQSDAPPKAETVPKTDLVSTPRSALASEELIDLHRKLIEKEKAVVDLEEKLATLKQKRAEDKSKLKDVEKLKMQNQQVCFSRQMYCVK